MKAASATKSLGVSPSEAAELLGVSKQHVYSCCAKGLIRHVRLGDKIIIPRSVIEELLRAPSAAER